ncbi:hypothetical protein PRZ48_007120 [Zasmidium cellare]|uniref:histidine kinase n=1 Tax=Zasmidium cellare TaxID=395010 RepID=A0ABR0EIQ8_ZASCE|nr:hypothetical protein PRZ48_007120 [Zasmidium cellare]
MASSQSASTANKPISARKSLLYESRREREFYRYYQPIRELTKAGPPLCDLSDEKAVKAHRPFSSPDRALTAFCQLGALRLGTRRAMLFFFDSNHAYVLAEATRSLSLQNDSVLVEEDDLWLGHTIIPRGYSVCEATVMLPQNEGSNKEESSSSLVHIVNDLSEDTRFCDRPFVTHGPKARFYAGVPITTPRGINIGAYCVLDDKKRDGLDEASVSFMRDMAATVMTHLEMVRATAEHKVGTSMIAGLGAFIDGASGFRDWAAQNADWNLDEDPNISHPLGVQPMTVETSAVAQAAKQAGEQMEDERRRSLTRSSPAPQRSRGSTITSSPSRGPQILNPRTLKGKKSADSFEDPVAQNMQRTFERAATLVREAMNVDGVIFLDAAVGTFGGLVEHPDSLSNTEQSSDCHNSAAETTTGTDVEEKMTKDSDQLPRLCHTLAYSFNTQAIINLEKNMSTIKRPGDMTEKFLRSLLRRYPRGKIWSFNEYGDASSDDESSEGNTDGGSLPCCSQSPSSGHSASCSKRHNKSRMDDCKEILRLLPGVRSVGIVGMWDHTRQRWYAASLFWSYSPLRLFSEESEVKYMTAFCDVILAELQRIEAQNSDRAKSDFISTISHELRSPLHGILGSVECLQETDTDSFSTDLISQVEICGRTLLDIIDHLLDFSKINHQAKTKAVNRGKISNNPAKRDRMGGMMALDADVWLDQVTEEVVETAVYSFCCSREAEMIMNRNVAVILDIDRSADIDWRCHVPIGAWKRICINLVSNALKYTSNGHIRVSLKAHAIPDKRKRFNVTFTVSDTGRGMSRDFLENHLFRAFAQEDSLVEGTGLGMNLVAKIVKSLDGRIEVQSERGIGSTFAITLPLEKSRPVRDSTAKSSRKMLESSVKGIAVGVIDNSATPLASAGEVPDQTARALIVESVHKTLTQVGVEAVQCTWAGDDKAEMYLVTEGELNDELQRRRDMGCADQLMSPSALSNKPFIVLCDSTLSARRIRAPGLGNIANGYIELIAQPAGPDRLIKAIASCVRHKSLINQPTPLVGAIHDIAAITPPADEHISTDNLPSRSRKDTCLDSPTADDFKRSDAKTEAHKAEAERVRVEKLNRGLASDYKFPRIPTPSLNGSKPRVTSSASKATQTKKSPERGSDAGVSLLLVDDNPINLQLLVTYATKNGHRRIVATDGQQAIDAYKNACDEASHDNQVDHGPVVSEGVKAPLKPQVVLMDINMPVLDGFEATRQIRAFEKLKGLRPAKIIALTGLGSASAQQEAFTSGVDLFLTKPVRLKELTKILDGIQKD